MPRGKGTYGSKVGRPAKKKMTMAKGGVMKAKGVSLSGLSSRQANTMKKHSKHHTAKHIRAMVTDMKKGMSFSASHKKAQKKVGK